jgi:anti-sigma factor RsiW
MLLGVYVLGGLRGDEHARVSRHLARCSRCRAEYEELAEVPPLLDLIIGEESGAAAGPAAIRDASDPRPVPPLGPVPGGAIPDLPAAGNAVPPTIADPDQNPPRFQGNSVPPDGSGF